MNRSCFWSIVYSMVLATLAAACSTLATKDLDSRPDVFDVAQKVQDGEHRAASKPTNVAISSCPSVTAETINAVIRVCKEIRDLSANAPKTMRHGETFAAFERRSEAFEEQMDTLDDRITALVGRSTYSLGDYAVAVGEGVGNCGAGSWATGGAVSRRGQPGISRGKCAVAFSGGYLSLDNSWFGSDMCVKTWRVGNQHGRLPIDPTILTDPRWQDCSYMKIIELALR